MSAYEQLIKVTNEHKDTLFDEILRKKLGSEGTPIPLVLQYSVGKFQSSFPAMYLEGDYPSVSRDGGREAKTTMLLQQIPERSYIKDIAKEWKDDEKIINAIMRRKVSYPASDFGALDTQRVKNYLSKVDKEGSIAVSTLARLILQNTTFLSFSDIQRALLRSWQKFTTMLKSKYTYYIVLSGKVGSEYMLIQMLWRHIQELSRCYNIALILERDIPTLLHEKEGREEVQFAIIDDALYSGIHQGVTIDENTYKYKGQLRPHFHLIVPYVSKDAEELLHSIASNNKVTITLYNVYTLRTIKDLLQCHEPTLRGINTMEQAQQVIFPATLCPVIE